MPRVRPAPADLTAEDWIIMRLLRVVACQPGGQGYKNHEYIRASNYMIGKLGVDVACAAARTVTTEHQARIVLRRTPG